MIHLYVVIKNACLQQRKLVLVINELNGLTKAQRNVKIVYRHPLRAARLKASLYKRVLMFAGSG